LLSIYKEKGVLSHAFLKKLHNFLLFHLFSKHIVATLKLWLYVIHIFIGLAPLPFKSTRIEAVFCEKTPRIRGKYNIFENTMKDGIKNQDSLLSSIFPLDLLHFLSSTRTEVVGEEIPGIRGKYKNS
jgi:hypothetical protein